MISIKTSAEQAALRTSGKILGELMSYLIAAVEPDIELLQLEALADDYIRRRGVKPAFKGYKGYRNILCTSVNEEVVHCPPTKRKLIEGDIISIDAGVIYQKMYSDCAVTVPVGKVSAAAQHLIQITRDALYTKATNVIAPGVTTGDIGYAIQTHVETAGYHVVRTLVGHGIGKALHEEPSIPNYGSPGSGTVLQAGMAIAVEPMVTIESPEVIFNDDGWRVVSADGKLSAHFEHTFLITETGCEVLTQF